MDYRARTKEEQDLLQERYDLAAERIAAIASGEENGLEGHLREYFIRTARFLSMCGDRYELVRTDMLYSSRSFMEMLRENHAFYDDIIPVNYGNSFANPACAVDLLGEEYGRILSFLYVEMRSQRAFVFEQDLYRITILNELFLEVYYIFTRDEPSYKKVRDVVYGFLYDNAMEWVGERTRDLIDPGRNFAVRIIMDSDLTDLRYLYKYGEYISVNEFRTADFLNSLPEEEIRDIASTFTEGFRRGLLLKGIDLSRKHTVNIRYQIGYERVIRAAIMQFREMGLEPVIFRYAMNTLIKSHKARVGYMATSPNPQYEYDHRFDDAIYFDRRMLDRKLDIMKKVLEENASLAEGYAGPAWFEVFGEEPFSPVFKPEAYRLSERQQKLTIEYAARYNQLLDHYISQEKRSYTMIAYPVPSIGEPFPEIFEAVRQINSLDNDSYINIQQKIIDTLDQAEKVRIMGKDENMTNLTVALSYLDDKEKQTKFENCVADVNIPVGEVFTSPKLVGTEGLLHVSSVYLNGLLFKDLRITFEEGRVTDYSCGNFPDPAQGRKYIEENIFFGHSRLPMGEFAIGTNTTAYAIANKYNIMEKMPILIAEKMGPHIALGDTCYSYEEDAPVYNPDGKEMIARENECSALRDKDLKQAYFNCHTDITIPYEDIARLVAVTEDRIEIPIIMEGRFILEGTFDLNIPLDDAEEDEE
ncbi:MAG: aminopeptidase [Eubacterium sp.]|nr:aminopeptidase [Eubacterium sp.]